MKKVLIIIAEVLIVSICQVIGKAYPVARLVFIAIGVLSIILTLIITKRNDPNKIDYKIVEGKKQIGNKTRKEYLDAHVPSYIIRICKEEKDINEMENRLNLYVKKHHIDRRIAKALVEEYGVNQ